MRIGQITYTFRPIVGGGDVYTEMLWRLLEREGHSQRVYQRFAGVKDENLRFVPNPLAGLRKGEFWTQSLFLPCLRKELQKEDILIAHYPIYLLAAARARKGGKPALIGLSHGVTWDDNPGSIRAKIKKAVARRAFRIADGFVANDTFFLREMGLQVAPQEKFFSEITSKRWFIPNCVSPDFSEADFISGLLELQPVILPRNFYRNRGIHLAVEAFKIFSREYPQAHLVILGEKSQPAYAASIKEMIYSFGLQNRVIIWGHIPHQLMARFYASAEMCLIPSLCGEGTSLSALEAMACGLAVITTDVAGLKDLPALQAAPRPEALAQVMLSTYPDRKKIGAEQQSRVRHDFSYARWARAWLEVIRQVS